MTDDEREACKMVLNIAEVYDISDYPVTRSYGKAMHTVLALVRKYEHASLYTSPKAQEPDQTQWPVGTEQRLKLTEVQNGMFPNELCCQVDAKDRSEVIFAKSSDVSNGCIRCGVMKQLPEGLLVEIPVATNEAVRRFVINPDQLLLTSQVDRG